MHVYWCGILLLINTIDINLVFYSILNSDVITQDMMSWENGKMWPFSCYAYAKEVPAIEGIF